MPKILFIISICFNSFSLANPLGLKKLLTTQGYVEIPLKRNAVGHLEIRGEINGVEGRFTLDTGASGTVLDQKRSAKFKLSKAFSKTMAGGLGTSGQRAEKKILRKFKLGPYEKSEMRITVVDLTAMNKALSGQGVKPQDGVIGADILKSGNAIIDYKNGILYLTR